MDKRCVGKQAPPLTSYSAKDGQLERASSSDVLICYEFMPYSSFYYSAKQHWHRDLTAPTLEGWFTCDEDVHTFHFTISIPFIMWLDIIDIQSEQRWAKVSSDRFRKGRVECTATENLRSNGLRIVLTWRLQTIHSHIWADSVQRFFMKVTHRCGTPRGWCS